MILHSDNDNRGGGRVSATSEDFQALPQFSQTSNSNETYISLVTTRTDSDGSITQSLQIIAKR